MAYIFHLTFLFLHLPDMEDILGDRRGINSFTMLMILFGLMLVCLYLSLSFARMTLPLFFGVTDGSSFISTPAEQLKNPLALLYLQAVSSSIGFFLLPVLLYHLIFRCDIISEMGMKTLPSARYWLLGIGVMVMAAVFTQLLVQLGAAIHLPEQWQSLRSPQHDVDKMIDAFFSDSSISRMLILTLVMALLPAIAEEFCFRGTIQNVLSRTNLGPIGAIFVSGLTFSLVHFEFDNFMAIWCMGIVLGYLYYYSGSIWINITAHFFNNFIVVAGKFAYMKGLIPTDVASNDTLPLYLTLPAGAAMIYGLILLRNWSGKKAVSSY